MITTDSSRVIVVEGKTDLQIISHLLEKIDSKIICDDSKTIVLQLLRERDLKLAICQEGGFDQLCKEVSIRLKESELECIGFVFDANGDPKGNWRKVRRRIVGAHKELQAASTPTLREVFHETPVSGGLWIRDYNPKVGMWMMPNNKETGAIEDCLAYMIHPKDHCWRHTQRYVETIFQEGKKNPNRKVKTLEGKNISKANIHAWLAVQEKPGIPPGTAIKAGYFNTTNPAAQSFQKWLGNLP